MTQLNLPPDISEEEFLAALRAHPDLELLTNSRELAEQFTSLGIEPLAELTIDIMLSKAIAGIAESPLNGHQTRMLLLLSIVTKGLFLQVEAANSFCPVGEFIITRMRAEFETAMKRGQEDPAIVAAIISEIRAERPQAPGIH